MLRRLSLASLSLLLVVALAAVADASTKKRTPARTGKALPMRMALSSAASRLPVIRNVAPMRAGIGDTLTITGVNFVRGRRKNMVVFKRDGGRAVFVRAASATRTRIRVRIPGKLAPFLPMADGQQGPARFRLRVLTKRLSPRFTLLRSSPLIGPSGFGRTVEAPATQGTTTGAETTSTTTTSTTGTSSTTSTGTTSGTGSTGSATSGTTGEAGSSSTGSSTGTTTGTDTTTGSATATSTGTSTTGTTGTSTPPPDCDSDGVVDDTDTDDDNDLLDDQLEQQLGTDRCLADSDGDSVTDAFEYQSARDLNDTRGTPGDPLPYPGKRPYPNALDPDATVDYDGDGLLLFQEYRLWVKFGSQAFPLTLNYSDGDQSTGPAQSAAGKPAHNDEDEDGLLSDEEKDADNDDLTNLDEENYRLNPDVWAVIYKNERPYPITYSRLDMLVPDTDGDGVKDGDDDQDYDGLTNEEELSRELAGGLVDFAAGELQPLSARVHPFNPCLPFRNARDCMQHPPADESLRPAPFDGSPGGEMLPDGKQNYFAVLF